VAVASAGPYASLHLAPDRQPHQHPTTQFFTGRMPLLPSNQQRQITEDKKINKKTVVHEMTATIVPYKLTKGDEGHYYIYFLLR